METVTGNIILTVVIVGAFSHSSSKALSFFFLQIVCGCMYFGEEILASSINALSY